jgi:hypothetical protein
MAYHVYRATDGRSEWPIITQYPLPQNARGEAEAQVRSDADDDRDVEVELLGSCRTFLVAWELAQAFIPSRGAIGDSFVSPGKTTPQ